MHCIDANYAVFSILPLYNTIHAQITDSFTFADWDGQLNSNLGTITVSVGSGTGRNTTSQPQPVSTRAARSPQRTAI